MVKGTTDSIELRLPDIYNVADTYRLQLSLTEKKQTRRNDWDHLPPAAPTNKSMVANERYIAKTNKRVSRVNSLPTQRKQKADTSPRLASSAPNAAKKQGSRQVLPKLNNLVKQPTEKKHHYDTRSNRNNGLQNGHAAGLSTISHERHLLTSKKFGSSWAQARGEHVKSDDQESDKNSSSTVSPTNSPRSKEYKPHGILKKATSMEENGAKTENKDTNNNNNQTKGNTRTKHQSSPTHMNGANQTKNASAEGSKKTNAQANDKVTSAPKLKEKQKTVVIDQESDDTEPMTYRKTPVPGERSPSRKTPASIERSPTRIQTNYVTKHEDIPPEFKRSKSIYALETKRILAVKTDVKTPGSKIRPKTGKKGQPNVPPWRRPKDYVFTSKEATLYKNATSVYGVGTDNLKRKRQHEFYKKLEDHQFNKALEHNEEWLNKQIRSKESKKKQQLQLKSLRERHSKEQYRRFMKQYVTLRVFENEKNKRSVYGLPEDLNKAPEKPVKLKRKKTEPILKFKKQAIHVKNVNKYSKFFNFNHGPRWDPNAKTPKMEGVDVVVMDAVDEDGNKVVTKLDVKQVVSDAQDLLDVPALDTARSLTSAKSNKSRKSQLSKKTGHTDPISLSLSSLGIDDDDDEDLFEKARQKYGLDLDSDDDSEDEVENKS